MVIFGALMWDIQFNPDKFHLYFLYIQFVFFAKRLYVA